MANLCIIPARGGSKRIPRKNIKDFLGKPIIAYSIETALNSRLFDEVMVSTDDEEIKQVALKYGAKVPFLRSEEGANDFASTMDVIKEVFFEYEKLDKSFDNVCCFYPCSPLTTVDRLKEGYALLVSKNFDSVFPIMSFSFPIQRAVKFSKGKISFFYPKYEAFRSQDLEKSYHDAGQFYWLKKKLVKHSDRIVTKNTGAIVISELEGQDIDNLSDWKLAELKYRLLRDE